MANNNSGRDKNEKDLVCSFCGKHQDEVERMIIGPGVNICSECIGLCHDLLSDKPDQPKSARPARGANRAHIQPADNLDINILTPAEIKEGLDQYVIGQDEAKRVLAVSVYNHYKRILSGKGSDVELQKSTELYRKTVEDNYLHSVFDFQQGTGYAYEFASMSPEHIEEILKNNWSGKHYSKSVWDNTDVLAEKLQQTLTIGLMSGKSYKRMAAELTELTSYGQYAAERLIRTETAYLIEESDKAAAIDRGTKVRIFRATLDLKTSKICREHDGDRVSIEKSVPGKNVPPLHPHCRSWMEEEIEGYEHRIRAARDPVTGERVMVPAEMKYADWYDKYVKNNPEAMAKEKALKNYQLDKKQYQEYENILGVKKVPKTLKEFQEMKYSNSEEWLKKQLSSHGCKRLSDVFLATGNQQNTLNVYLKNNRSGSSVIKE